MMHMNDPTPDDRSGTPGRPGRGQSLAVAGLTIAVLTAGMAMMLPAAQTDAAPADGTPVVVELFTSQSCYSCPPAEAKLAEFAQRTDIIALEHHVDYWDSLVYGAAGRWKDVFSSPDATERQRVYNAAIPGRGHSYTPQIVVGGYYEAVGSRDGEVNEAIRDARRQTPMALSVAARSDSGDGLHVTVTGPAPDKPAGIWLVRYLREHVTEVRSGENKGKTLAGRNIVPEMRRIGEWRGDAVVIDLAGAKPDAEHGCAVLVQPDALGSILGAAYCDLEPRPPS